MLVDNIIQAVNANQTVFFNQEGNVHDRSKTVGGSESWQCIRKTFFNKTGHPMDNGYVENKGYFLRGHVIEEVVIDLLNKNRPIGTTYKYTGTNQVTLVEGNVSATPDCLMILEEGVIEIVVEIKSLDPRSNFDNPKEQHVFQTQLQIELFHIKTQHRPKSALLIYMDAADFSHVVEHVVKRNPSVLSAAKDRADRVFSANQATDLLTEGKYSDECRYCPYSQACGENIESININLHPQLGENQNYEHLTMQSK